MIYVSFGIILLNEEQEKKLLEMCSLLKKDYKFEDMRFEIEKYGSSNKFVCFIADDGTTRVHWFQMCLTHFPHRLFKQISPYLAASNVIAAMSKGIHPVDFLHEKYLKLAA